jgi:FSR family fosmidomycin resistance protein-like MFS transporter
MFSSVVFSKRSASKSFRVRQVPGLLLQYVTMSEQPLAMTPAKSGEEPQEGAAVTSDFQTGQVTAIAVGHFTHDTYSAFLAPLLPTIQSALALNYTQAGSLAIFTQIPSLLNPFIGYLADKVSVRYFVILAPAVTATLFSSIGLVSSYLALALLLFAAGISIAAFHAPAPAMVAKVAGSRVGTGMSIFMAAGEFARAVGPLVVASGVVWFGMEGIWRLAIIGWLVSLFLYFSLRNVAAVPHSQGGSSLTEFWSQARRVFPPLTWLLSGRIFMMAALTTYLPIFISDERQGGLWLAAASLTILEAAGVAGALMSGTLSDRFGRKKVLLVLLTAAPIIMLAFTNSPTWLSFPLLLLLGLAAISPQPVLLATVQDQFPNNRALGNGTFLALNFLIRAFGIWAVGFFADAFGLSAAFAATAVLAFFSIPAIFFLPSKQPSKLQRTS